MQVLSVTYGTTQNMGGYESQKVELTAAPANGQSFQELVDELKAEVERIQLDGKPAHLTGGKDKGNKAPLANKKASSKAKQPAKSDGDRKERLRSVFKRVLNSDSLETLLSSFDEFTGDKDYKLLSNKEKNVCINQVQDKYKSLMSADADIDVIDNIVVAINTARHEARDSK